MGPRTLSRFIAFGSVARNCHLRITSLKVGPDVGAAGPTALTYEAGLNVRQPHLVQPRGAVQGDVMAAVATD
ncbi:protein of unknown function [Bradyrhizobium vignae]|uniref:Uncharacterized protein n=1 Tax=Bradyrhizobium vignae TaxID=1549949 RepID=A0A2U3PVP5_9BRAD|nr:protein of unknown function [Bradyrhizobium vignae]